MWKKIIEYAFGENTEIVFPRFFVSKKNQVTLFHLRKQDGDFNVIAKYYVWGNGMKEMQILQKAYKSELNVPEPLKLIRVMSSPDEPDIIISEVDDFDSHSEARESRSFPGDILFTEHIPGMTFRILKDKKENLPVDKLAMWIADFHNLFKIPGKQGTMLKGDVMLPNFILQDKTGEVFGIDFEEAEWGNEIVDVSDILTTLLLMEPPFSDESLNVARTFMQKYLSRNPIEIDTHELKGLIIHNLERRILYTPARKSMLTGLITRMSEGGCRKAEGG